MQGKGNKGEEEGEKGRACHGVEMRGCRDRGIRDRSRRRKGKNVSV